MKNIYSFILFLASMFTLTGCNDWLDVAPSNQVNEGQLFESGEGFRNALNGIYLNLGDGSLYGRNQTWGFMDAIAQYYDKYEMQSSFAYYKAINYQFDDSDVKSIISSVWTNTFRNIANCNNLILHVSQADPGLFSEREFERNMIWGEALALRAFMHFEILRMFAPVKDDGKSYIPYVDSYPTIAPLYETNSSILKKVVRDLKEAKAKLAECDKTPEHIHWMKTEMRMLGSGLLSDDLANDIFFAYRGYRMNYYAITALLARVYCWQGEYELAYNEAKEVMDVTDEDGASCFDFAEYTDLSTNRKDYNSIILSFFNKTLQEDYKPYITKGNQNLLVMDAESVFGNESADRRFASLTSQLSYGVASLKYDIDEQNDGYDMLPIIRLSEMYYIASEYYADKGDYENAGKMLDEVRVKRGILTSNLTAGVNADNYIETLLKEMRAEFAAEGQMFYQYKRLNRNPGDNGAEVDDAVIFVFDKPENEDV